jgi:DegV family protein with EDD domain
MTARDAMPGAPVRVLDTQQAGIGMWPAIIRVAQLAQRGVSAWEIEQSALAILKRTRAYFMVESLEYLRRNGRIGRAREMVGTLLDAHPILTVEDGEVTPVENVRPRQRALERMCELALEGVVDRLLVCGTSVESIGEVEEALRHHYRGPVQNTWLGPTLGANTGPAVAIACVSR